MGWIKEVPFPHECPLPHLRGQATGSIWECDHCGQKWRVDTAYRGGGGSWKRIVPIRVDPVEYDYAEKDPLPWWRRF